MMTERVSTGLTGLDAQFGGGLPRGSCIMLAGPPMNALELLGYHFADGGENTTYYSSGREIDHIKESFGTIGLDPSNVSFDVIPDKTPKMTGNGRIVIDNFSDIYKKFGDIRALSAMVEVRKLVRKSGEIAVFLVIEGMHTDAEMTQMRAWADGVMDLGVDRQGFGLYPYVRVTKMRGVPDSTRLLLFKETDKGLFMESTRRVF